MPQIDSDKQVANKEPSTTEHHLEQNERLSDYEYAKVETVKLKDKGERLRKKFANESISVLDKRLEFLSSSKESQSKLKSMNRFKSQKKSKM